MGIREASSVCVLAVAAGFLGALLAGRVISTSPVAAQGDQTIAAQELKVVDQAGALRARISVDGLELKDSRGITRISLRVAPDGTAFALFLDKSGGGSYFTNFQTPSVNFIDAQGRVTASLPWSGGGGGRSDVVPIALLERPCIPSPGVRCPSSVADEASLQNQIDSVRSKVNELAVLVNKLAH
jgi:hypothetical protein